MTSSFDAAKLLFSLRRRSKLSPRPYLNPQKWCKFRSLIDKDEALIAVDASMVPSSVSKAMSISKGEYRRVLGILHQIRPVESGTRQPHSLRVARLMH